MFLTLIVLPAVFVLVVLFVVLPVVGSVEDLAVVIDVPPVVLLMGMLPPALTVRDEDVSNGGALLSG